jgi:hypothetical protein
MKYRFARLYLGIMLIIAILGLIGGLMIGGYQWLSAASVYGQASTLRDRPYTINTSRVVNELQTTKQLLLAYFGNDKFGNIQLPSDKDFSISESAHLSPKDLRLFESYLDNASEARDSLKAAVAGSIDNSMTSLMRASQDALPKQVESTSTRSYPASSPFASTPIDHIYEPEVITADSVRSLRDVSEFLANKISYYTPSGDARNLAAQANLNLIAIIDLLEAERKAYLREDFTVPLVNNPEPIAQRSPTKQEALIREFISCLRQVVGIVKENTLEGWRLDTALKDTKTACQAARSERTIEITRLKMEGWNLFTTGARTLLLSILASVLLLVLRDFMSAVIDTAANTGEMAKRLSSLVVDESK